MHILKTLDATCVGIAFSFVACGTTNEQCLTSDDIDPTLTVVPTQADHAASDEPFTAFTFMVDGAPCGTVKFERINVDFERRDDTSWKHTPLCHVFACDGVNRVGVRLKVDEEPLDLICSYGGANENGLYGEPLAVPGVHQQIPDILIESDGSRIFYVGAGSFPTPRLGSTDSSSTR